MSTRANYNDDDNMGEAYYQTINQGCQARFSIPIPIHRHCIPDIPHIWQQRTSLGGELYCVCISGAHCCISGLLSYLCVLLST